MVEELDHYVGKLFDYLETTEDPRWPGHMLSENTYVFFTSDNGGMERHPGEIITDNFPLDRGKISAMEGGDAGAFHRDRAGYPERRRIRRHGQRSRFLPDDCVPYRR